MGRPRKQSGQGLPLRVYMRSGTLYYVHATDGRWENLGKDLKTATAKADAYNCDKAPRGTVGWWLDEFVTYFAGLVKDGDRAGRTLSDYKKNLIPLKAYFGAMDPMDVETPHVTSYVTAGRLAGRKTQSNREKACLSSCFGWMIEHKHAGMERNPCKGAKRNRERARDRYISDDEYARVFADATAPVRAWMELMYRTLQRPADILTWTHAAISVEGGREVLSFRQHKTKTPVKIEVSAKLRAAFDAMAAARMVSSLYLICKQDGGPYKLQGLTGMFRRHVDAAGVIGFGIQDCKGKGATDMLNGGVPLVDISNLCAHKSLRTTEIYIKARNPKIMKSNDRTISLSKTAEVSPVQSGKKAG